MTYRRIRQIVRGAKLNGLSPDEAISLLKGLSEADAGKLIDRGSFEKYLKEV